MGTSAIDAPAECRRARLRISRRADHDLDVTSAGQDRLEAHLTGCAACRVWQQQTLFLQRSVAASRLDPPTGGASMVLAATVRSNTLRQQGSRVVRGLLTAIAILGLAMAAPALALGSDDGIETHAAHEIGSTEVAICVGLLAAALWPRRARGVLAVVGAAATLLVLTAGDDILAGRTTLWHELPHGIAVLGAMLVWALARLVPELQPPVPLPAASLFESGDEAIEDFEPTSIRETG